MNQHVLTSNGISLGVSVTYDHICRIVLDSRRSLVLLFLG